LNNQRKLIPQWERNTRISAALILIVWGVFGVARNNLLWLGIFESHIYLRGAPAWLMFGALNCAAASLLTVVISQYDSRNNDQAYRTFKRRIANVGWSLFLSSIVAIIFFPLTN
jgi:hypothetical protein